MRLNAKQIQQYTGAEYLIEPIDASAILTGCTWDSRDVKPGWLFAALPGERVNGIDFVGEALRAGACGILASECPSAPDCVLAREMGAFVMRVPNVVHALSDLAREWRHHHLHGLVVGITGSVGKTTTKNLVRDVCSTSRRTCATSGNQNNELGVPKTLLDADPDAQVIIVEMGMQERGEIAMLCEMARPDWGVVTVCGSSHIEFLGSRKSIAEAKAELLESLPSGTGRAFINAEDDFAGLLEHRAKGMNSGVTCVSFNGCMEDVEVCVWPEDVRLDASGRAEFTVCAKGFVQEENVEPTLFDMEPDVVRAECSLSLMGLHNVANACSAIAVGLSLGIPMEVSCKALSESIPEAGRAEVLQARSGFTVINDAYNATPDSMRASLAAFADMHVEGRRIAVLGDMGELGDFAPECHVQVGQDAAKAQLDELVCVGELMSHAVKAALDAGMAPEAVKHVETVSEALALLECSIEADDAVLVKASHFMGLDRLVRGLVS